jgi:hypothetical protein
MRSIPVLWGLLGLVGCGASASSDASPEPDGTVPVDDAGADAPDARPADVGRPLLDAAAPAGDAALPGRDAAGPEPDATGPEPDAVVPETDAAAPEPDAVVPETDAAAPEPEPDAAVPEPDAAVPPPAGDVVLTPEAGCVEGEIRGVVSGSRVEDTTAGRGDQVDGLCRRSGGNEDTILSFTVPETGRWEIFAESAAFDPVVAVRRPPPLPGFCDGGEELACDDDGGGGPNRALAAFEAQAGERLLVVVDAFRGTGQGPYALTFTLARAGGAAGGACLGEGERLFVEVGVARQTVAACHVDTCADPATAGECTSTCMQTFFAPAFGAACADCFGAFAVCTRDACGFDCLTLDGACAACADAACGAELNRCTGI